MGRMSLFHVIVQSVDLKKEWVISDYPLEEGGFESYDKVLSSVRCSFPFWIRRMRLNIYTVPSEVLFKQLKCAWIWLKRSHPSLGIEPLEIEGGHSEIRPTV